MDHYFGAKSLIHCLENLRPEAHGYRLPSRIVKSIFAQLQRYSLEISIPIETYLVAQRRPNGDSGSIPHRHFALVISSRSLPLILAMRATHLVRVYFNNLPWIHWMGSRLRFLRLSAGAATTQQTL